MRKLSDISGTGGGTGLIIEPTPTRRPRIGIALGAGAARGWAHIGVLRELAANGIFPDVVAGTSIGAVVGACYAADRLDALESFSRGLTKRGVFGLMDLSFSGLGLLTGGRLKNRLDHELTGTIEQLGKRFAAVATEIGTGHEIWLTKGPIVPALRASYALPGIFEPVRLGGRWLFDGALVNPVPVSVCRALGAEMVIAVNLVGDNAFRGTIVADQAALDQTLDDMGAAVAAAPQRAGMLLAGVRNLRRHFGRREDGAPGMAGVMMDAFNITQDRIARSRLAGDPPDVIVNARLNAFGLFDFHRSDELIAMGRESVRRAMPDIRDYIAHTPAPVGPPMHGL